MPLATACSTAMQLVCNVLHHCLPCSVQFMPVISLPGNCFWSRQEQTCSSLLACSWSFRFVYESERLNGVSELLEILGRYGLLYLCPFFFYCLSTVVLIAVSTVVLIAVSALRICWFSQSIFLLLPHILNLYRMLFRCFI